MTMFKETSSLDELDLLLTRAQQKVNAPNVHELSKYLPSKDGFYMHHFSMMKLKKTNPEKLKSLIEKFILQVENPVKLQIKPRNSKKPKKSAPLNLGLSELQALIELAEHSNNSALAEKLRTNLPFSAIKQEMLRCIREERVDLKLWNSYVGVINSRR